jgi:hypothetical protein
MPSAKEPSVGSAAAPTMNAVISPKSSGRYAD